MKVATLSKNTYRNLENFTLNKSILNTEGKIYLIPTKENWAKKKKILKEYYTNQGKYMGQKLLTVNALIDNSELINSYNNKIIIPDAFAVYNDKTIGVTMPYVNSIGLNQLLSDLNINLENKINYLKDIGRILEDMSKIRKYTPLDDFCLNDIHEDNFIIGKEDKQLYVIDTDSCKIQGNYPPVAKLLTSKSKGLSNLPNKYIEVKDYLGTSYIPNEQTDLYCYTMIILNFLYQDRKTDKLSQEEYYNYLEYLNKLGLSKELLTVFETVFTNTMNQNPYQILDCIKDVYPRSIKNVYEYVNKKDSIVNIFTPNKENKFNNMKKYIDKYITCKIQINNGKLKEVKGILKDVIDYSNVVIDNVSIPLIGKDTMIISINDNDNIVYSIKENSVKKQLTYKERRIMEFGLKVFRTEEKKIKEDNFRKDRFLNQVEFNDISEAISIIKHDLKLEEKTFLIENVDYKSKVEIVLNKLLETLSISQVIELIDNTSKLTFNQKQFLLTKISELKDTYSIKKLESFV